MATFLAYFASQNTFREHLMLNISGIGGSLVRVRPAVLDVLPIALPPLAEQRRIVEKLDAVLSEIDVGEAALDDAEAALVRYRKSVLAAAVDGRLSEAWRAAHPPDEDGAALLARLAVEHRAAWEAATEAKYQAKDTTPPKNWKTRYVAPAPPDPSALAALPEGWTWASVEQIIAEPLSNGRSVQTRAGGFPVLRLTALGNSTIDLREHKEGDWEREDAAPWLVQKGDFLLSRGNGSIKLVGLGGVVRSATPEVAFPDTMIRLRPLMSLTTDYLQTAWSSYAIRTQIEVAAKTTAGIHKINQGDLERMMLPLPPLPEQHAIVAEVERRFEAADVAAAAIREARQKAKALRAATLRDAFVGRLLPQDPSDEPADVLLARIAAERADVAPVPRKRGRPAGASTPAVPSAAGASAPALLPGGRKVRQQELRFEEIDMAEAARRLS